MSDSLGGMDPKEWAMHQGNLVRAHARESSMNDVFGEEQVLFGPLLPPAHVRAWIMEFGDMEEAKEWYEACRTAVRVKFAQLARQDNTHSVPYLVRWGTGEPELPVLWKPASERWDRATIRFGVCLICHEPVSGHRVPCVEQKPFNTGHLTHIRTWGDEWGFKHGNALPELAFGKFSEASEYCNKNFRVFGWLRLQRFRDDKRSYYVVERRNVTRAKPQARPPRSMLLRCDICNLPVIECPGSHDISTGRPRPWRDEE